MNPRRSDVPDRGRDVWPLVGQPLVELAGGAAHVILSPDADLNLLPFAALIDDRGEYLGRRVLLTYVNSARELAPAPAQARPGPALIVSNPAFGAAAARAFEPLAGADAEARALASMIEGAQWLRGARATEGALKRAARPAILHVATHGFFLREGDAALAAGTRGLKTVGAGSAIDIPPLLRSGLALAGANQGGRDGEDGILTAGEAAHLDLRGTELVFLSACETGLGVVNAGESVYGLRRAFAIAGARSQAITLWQVSDDATRQFVVAFYRALLGGASRGEALRRAQTEAIADPARAHPFYWAAFIVSGDTGPLGRRQ
jgi:CHAT domain-containing protein